MTQPTDGQMGLDGTEVKDLVIDDEHLERLLSRRLEKMHQAAEVRKIAKAADKEAREALAKYDFPEGGGGLRVGRHLIHNKYVPEKHVEYDTTPGNQLEFDTADDAEPTPAEVDPAVSERLDDLVDDMPG